MNESAKEMFEFRQKGDYKDLTEFKREDVKLWLGKGKDFVRRMEEITRDNKSVRNRLTLQK